MKKLILFFLLVSSLSLFAQVSPQIQGAGAPSNPCYNGGQQYVDQTNHVIYSCPSSGANWVNLGIGQTSGSGGAGGGVSGGTFGASPSSGYTFTSTPITTSPFGGDLLIGASTNANATGSYSAGSGYTLATSTIALGLEYQLSAGSATSFSAPFTYSQSTAWSGAIAAFSGTPAFVQSTSGSSITALAFSSNNGAGDLLIAAVRYNTGSDAGPITSITDTRGNTWVLAGLRAPEAYNKGVGNTNFLEVWYALNSAAGANTITLHGLTGPAGIHIAVAEFSGIATSNALVDYNFAGSATAVTSIPGATTNNQYTINAVNNTTGAIDFTGRDSGAVFRSAANAKASTGGLFFFKNGIYPGQTALQENVASQTNYYIWGIPAPVGSTQVSFHIVCESFTQILYSSLQTDGCIHTIMPSAYSGAEPNNVSLSGFWQRPSVTFGATNNNADYFVNNTCRIPDNQSMATTCYDTFTSTFSSHVGTVADTAIVPVDQICSGLTAAAANMTGFRTNQTNTDEVVFDNTWAIGFNTPYNVLSNHPLMNNVHAVCNNSAGSLTLASGSTYGGEMHHFQDIHNINGLTLNCAFAGTRYDFSTYVREPVGSGAFLRSSEITETTPGNCVGRFEGSTNGAAGVGLNPGPFFAAGSGINYRSSESAKILIPGLITSKFTSAATTGTTKQTLATYTFPFSSLAYSVAGIFFNNPGAVIRIKAWGITAANANSKTFEIDFGGTAIATITSTANNGSIRCSAEIIVSSAANTQEIMGECDDGTTHTVTRTAPGITGNATIVTNIAATTGTSSGDFTFKGLTVEYVGGN